MYLSNLIDPGFAISSYCCPFMLFVLAKCQCSSYLIPLLPFLSVLTALIYQWCVCCLMKKSSHVVVIVELLFPVFITPLVMLFVSPG